MMAVVVAVVVVAAVVVVVQSMGIDENYRDFVVVVADEHSVFCFFANAISRMKSIISVDDDAQRIRIRYNECLTIEVENIR